MNDSATTREKRRLGRAHRNKRMLQRLTDLADILDLHSAKLHAPVYRRCKELLAKTMEDLSKR